MASRGRGWAGSSAASPASTATGLCIVRIEHQGPAGLLVTVTSTPDVTGAPARVTTRRTVDPDVAVEEVRAFLDEFRRGR